MTNDEYLTVVCWMKSFLNSLDWLDDFLHIFYGFLSIEDDILFRPCFVLLGPIWWFVFDDWLNSWRFLIFMLNPGRMYHCRFWLIVGNSIPYDESGTYHCRFWFYCFFVLISRPFITSRRYILVSILIKFMLKPLIYWRFYLFETY